MESQVYTTAAPPYANLKNLLWAEIDHAVEINSWLFSDLKHTTLRIERHPKSFLVGVAIPQSGTEQQRESKFCAGADDLFEMTDGSVVTYKSLVGRKVNAVSVDPEFNKVEAEAEFFDNGIEEVYEIILSSGEKVLRTGKHPLFRGEIAQSRKTMGGTHVSGRSLVQNEEWAFVEGIQKGDAILVPEDTSFNFGSLVIDANELKVLAYLIGDGYIGGRSSPLFIQEDNKQLAEFKEAVFNLGATVKANNLAEYSWRVSRDSSSLTGSNVVTNLLREHNLWGKVSSTKYVPEKVNQSTRECIALFLSRLFSTDGWACISKAGSYKKAEIGYASKSERLVRDIQRLLFRFGINSKVVRRKSSWEHKGIRKVGTYWSCVINKSLDIIRFADAIGIYGKEAALEECVSYARGRGVYASWRKSKHDGFCWEKVRSVRLLGKRHTVGVCVPGNSTYLTRLVEHNSGKHSKNTLFIVDEGDAVPDECYRGIESCMTGGNARLLVMFNPRAERGAVYHMIRDGVANVVDMSALSHPNVLRGYDVIPGAVRRSDVVRRFNEWSRPLAEGEEPDPADADYFEVPDFLAGEAAEHPAGGLYPPLSAGWRKVTHPELHYIVFGHYPTQPETQLISRSWVYAARSRWDAYVAQHGDEPPEGTKGIMGLDLAEYGGDSNVACFRYGGFVAMPIVWNGMDADSNAEQAAHEFRERKNLSHACVDAIGIGSGVAPLMRKGGCRAQAVKISERPTMKIEAGKFRQLRDELLWRVREWLRSDVGAMLPPDELLLEELLKPTYRTPRGYIEITKKDSLREQLRRSPDRLDALALSFAPEQTVCFAFV